jgi:hypothetical protein
LELEQKITELSIDFQHTKGKIMQGYRKMKEELIKLGKKNKEDQNKKNFLNYQPFKKKCP